MDLGCQTCLCVIRDPSGGVFINNVSSSSDELPLKEKLLDLVPELVLDSIENVILCNSCVENLMSAYKFKQGCLDTQEKIYGFLQLLPENDGIDVGKIAMHYRRLELIAQGIHPVVEEPVVPQNSRSCDFSYADEPEMLHVNNKSHYKCDQCPFIFPTSELLQDHLATHYKEETFSCKVCPFVTISQEKLTEHALTHNKHFECKICQQPFCTRYDLAVHIKGHFLTEQPTTKQPTTKQPTTKQPTTKQPITKQPTTKQPTTKQPPTKQPTNTQPTTNQPTTYQPTTNQPTTNQPATNQPTTKQPTTKQPTTEPPTTTPPTQQILMCGLCQFKCYTIKNLRQHVSVCLNPCHTVTTTPFHCGFCEFKAAVPRHLTFHMQMSHMSPYHCKQCTKVFRKQEALNLHIAAFHKTLQNKLKAPTIVQIPAQDLNRPKLPSLLDLRLPQYLVKSETAQQGGFGPPCKLMKLETPAAHQLIKSEPSNTEAHTAPQNQGSSAPALTPSDMILKQLDIWKQEAAALSNKLTKSEPPTDTHKLLKSSPLKEKASETTKRSSIGIHKNDKILQDKVGTQCISTSTQLPQLPITSTLSDVVPKQLWNQPSTLMRSDPNIPEAPAVPVISNSSSSLVLEKLNRWKQENLRN